MPAACCPPSRWWRTYSSSRAPDVIGSFYRPVSGKGVAGDPLLRKVVSSAGSVFLLMSRLTFHMANETRSPGLDCFVKKRASRHDSPLVVVEFRRTYQTTRLSFLALHCRLRVRDVFAWEACLPCRSRVPEIPCCCSVTGILAAARYRQRSWRQPARLVVAGAAGCKYPLSGSTNTMGTRQ